MKHHKSAAPAFRRWGLAVGFIVLALLVLALWRWWFQSRESDHTATVPAPVAQQPPVPMPVPKAPVIDLNAAGTDPQLNDLMAERKRIFGIKEGLDAITDKESLKVGDALVPLPEILDRIRIERGNVIEEPLGPSVKKTGEQELGQKIRETLDRVDELTRQLNDGSGPGDPEKRRQIEGELARLKPLIDAIFENQQIQAEIDDLHDRMNASDPVVRQEARDRMYQLQMRKNTLEQAIQMDLQPDQPLAIYGIYLVRPGDNLWNIHFAFLKNFFQNRGVTLSARADEPDIRGRSSGVGKILKFSEKMVHIYNVKEQKLSGDLNLLQPNSKVVIFNLGQALQLLRQIDWNQIDQVQFDGENLWVPSPS